MSAHVSSPEQNVGLDVVSDEFEHLSKSGRSSIASVISPRTSSIFRVSWVTILLSTAKRGVAVGISTLLVIEVNMNIRVMDSFKSLSSILTLDTLIELLNKIIALKILRLVSKNSGDIIVLFKFNKFLLTHVKNISTKVVRTQKEVGKSRNDNVSHLCDSTRAYSVVLVFDQVAHLN